MKNAFKHVILLIAILFTINLNAQDSSVAQDAPKSKTELVDEAKAQVSKMSANTLKGKMDKNEKFILIDVRTEGEYLAGHIKGAVWIPRGKLEFVIQKVEEDPNAELVLYCRSGGRSALSVVTVMEMGYNNIYSLTGGFREWTESGNHVFNRHGEIAVIAFEKKETEEEK